MPIVREPLDPRISLWNWLAFELRYQRELHGLSLTQAGKIIHAARSTVSNMEAGRQRLNEDQAELLDARYGTGHLLRLLLYFARLGHDPDWFRQYTEYEAGAEIIRVYQNQCIPMPLQTEAYCRALLKESNVDDLETALKSRLLRRDMLLERGDSPFVWVLLGECALEYEVGGHEVIRGQLEYLLELSQRSNVCVRVVLKSAGAHRGMNGPFRIVSGTGRDIGYSPAYGGGRLIETPSEVRTMSVDYERVSQKALSERDTCMLIERKLEWYRCTSSGVRAPTAG